MKELKSHLKQYTDPKAPDQELRYLLHFILALSKKQRRKLFIELSKYDL